jgi:exonuclease III
MKTQGVFAWCLQETWRVGDSIEQHEEGFVSILHGPQERMSRRGSLGVAIVLSPEAWKGVRKAGCKIDYYGLRIMAVSITLTDENSKDVSIRLITAYAPHSGCTEQEKEEYESMLALAIASCGEQEILIIGSDTNASLSKVSSDQQQDSEFGTAGTVGKFGCDWTNTAGERMASFLGIRALCLPTTFFRKKESYATWFHMRNKKGYQIDHFMMARKDLKRVVDAGTTIRHSADSDHRAIFIKVRICRNLAKPKQAKSGRVSRDMLQDPIVRASFVAEVERRLMELDSRLGAGEDTDRVNTGWRLKKDGKTIQQSLQEVLAAAAKAHLVATSRVNPGWFQRNQSNLLKSCVTRNRLQKIFNKDPNPTTKHSLRVHQMKHKRLVQTAKRDWTMLRVSKINGNGGSFVGHYWEAVKDLTKGISQTRKINPLMFRDPITKIKCKTEEESGKVLVEHLDKLLNAVPAVEEDAINSVRQRPMRHDLDAAPLDPEIIAAIKRQNSGKATGDSKIPAEFYRACLESPAAFEVMRLILQRAWNDEEIPQEWVEGRIKMLPKDGDLWDPGRWRSITLLDAVAKIKSTILTTRLNTILEMLGIEMQNGFTPKRGTVDGSFSVRTLLKKRREHGLETYGYFLDLVKAFDTVPRKSLLRVLAKFGVPPKMVKMIENMYTNCSVKVDVGDKEFVIPVTAGVKQGDNLAPVLFLIYIQAVLETLDDKFPHRKKLPFGTKFDHIVAGRTNCKRGVTWFEIGESLYADDAFFGFQTRAELEEGAELIDRHFTAFGLQVHRGKPDKKSKTECMYFPRQGGCWEDGDTTNVKVDGGFYTFTKTFKYLGSIISHDLSADADVAARIRSATAAFGKLKKTVTSKRTELKQRTAIYVTIVISILLFGSEIWSLREDLIKKLDVFHNQCVRIMCHVTKHMQWKKKIRTSTLSARVGLPSIREMIAARQLRWAGHVIRMPDTRAPKMLLTSFVPHPRPRGRPEQTFGHSLRKFLHLRADMMDEDALNETFAFQPDAEVATTVPLTGRNLQAALGRSTKPVKNDVLTWIDICKDRDLFRMVVTNNYAVVEDDLLSPTAYDNIHANLPRPRRPPRARTKAPKLYAVWTGALHPEGRKVKIDKIFSSWEEMLPVVFKVSGANYCSAPHNAAGRQRLENWLATHRALRFNATLTRTGREFSYH